MQLRETLAEDKDSICRLHNDAFGESEGPAIVRLVSDLLADATARPLLSLVGEQDGQLVAHVIFSSVAVEDSDLPGGYIMAPLAVAPARQRTGVGGSLVKQGLSMLRERGATFVLVLGDPKYYSRFGFAAGHALKPPHELPYPEAWMALELQEGALTGLAGTVRCAESLSAPEYW